jgi:hypothetical protein
LLCVDVQNYSAERGGKYADLPRDEVERHLRSGGPSCGVASPLRFSSAWGSAAKVLG